MAEIEDALRAEVLGVCRIYYAQTWDEALNQAGVEASSVLRKAENIYYPVAIQVSSSSNSKTCILPEAANNEKGGPSKVPPPPANPSINVKQPKAGEIRAEVAQEVTLGANMPFVVSQDPPKDKDDARMEIVLASLPILVKGDSKGADQVSSKAKSQQTKVPPLGK